MTLTVLIVIAVSFYGAIIVGEWLRNGARELFDQPRSHWPDGDQFPVTPDDFKPFHVD